MKHFLITIASTSLLLSGLALAQDGKSPRRIPSDKQSWTKAVNTQLQRRSAYVASKARMQGIEGDLKLKLGFKLSSDGQVSNIRIIESSGNEAVDKIASEMPQMDIPFPGFTPDMGKNPISLVAPIILHLEPEQPVEEGMAPPIDPGSHPQDFRNPSGSEIQGQ